MIQTQTGTIASRLDRLPFSRTIWRYVFLISLGGTFELYDLIMTAYIAPGLVKSGLFSNGTVGLFGISGVGFFVFCTFMGMFIGSIGFGFVADRFGRRSMFTVSLLWYSAATLLMAFQTSALWVDVLRLVAAIGVGLEQVTIDTFLPELVPPQKPGQGVRVLPVHRVLYRPRGGLACVVAGAVVAARIGGVALGGAHRFRRSTDRLVAPTRFAREPALA